MNNRPDELEVISSLDTDELRELTRNHLDRHGIHYSVVSRSEKNRGIRQVAGEEDLISFIVSHPDWVNAIFWAAAFRFGLGKIFDGFFGKAGEDMFIWLKESVKSTMRQIREPTHHRFNSQGRVLVRFEGNLLVDNILTPVVIRLQYFPFEAEDDQSLEKNTSDAAVSDTLDLVFGNIMPFVIEASRLARNTQTVDELRVQMYIPPHNDDYVFISVGHAADLSLDTHGKMTVDWSASEKISTDIVRLFADFSRQLNKRPNGT